jgi:hypothetical protein
MTRQSYDDHIQLDEPQEIKTNPTASVHTPTPCKIPDRYKPLILPPILHDFPENYYKYLPRFDGEYGNITAEKHIQNFENFLDLFEVEEDDVSIRIFSLSLQGEAKKWFKNLPAASIFDFHQFVKVFLDKWVIKRNPFLILEEYNHLKRQPGETVQHFSARFNQVYHSMPADIKPPPGLALLHYPDAFDPEMAFQLRERNTTTLEEMQDNAIAVEANLLVKRSKLKEEERENIEKEHLTSSEVKLDILVSTMEEMMQKIIMRDELVVQKHHVPLIAEEEEVVDPNILLLILVTIDQKMIVLCIHFMDKDETGKSTCGGEIC